MAQPNLSVSKPPDKFPPTNLSRRACGIASVLNLAGILKSCRAKIPNFSEFLSLSLCHSVYVHVYICTILYYIICTMYILCCIIYI